MRGVSKRFGAVLANDAVDLRVPRGTIHGIVGENGAGKSTLMSILHGFHRPDGGAILVDGREVDIRDSRDAIRLGIDMVHQHFNLVERFTVLENVLLGAEGGPLLRGGIRRMRATLLELGRRYGLHIDPDARVEHLPVGLQQRVEILKSLARGARVLILDEPTAALTPAEAADLFGVLRALRAQGRTAVIVTHKLHEIMAVTDRVAVMRAGRMVAERDTGATSAAELGELMIGRRLPPPQRPAAAALGPVRLQARGLRVRDDTGALRVHDVSLAIRGGEVLGIAGVAGNGQSELLGALAGTRAPEAGTIAIDGRPARPGAAARRRAGVAHVPEDRLREGMLRREPAWSTAALGSAADRALRNRLGLLSPARMRRRAARLMREFDVRPADPALRSALFSGGNAQKLILGREIDRDPAVLLVGQPTRGVDIGGIAAIHDRLRRCRAEGRAVLLVSAELDEIIALSDRILVMAGGRIAGELPAADATAERLGVLMAGPS